MLYLIKGASTLTDIYYIIAFLGTTPLPGDIQTLQNPQPHVTFLADFQVQVDRETELVFALENLAHTVSSFDIKALHESAFGLDQEHRVIECEKTIEANALHTALLNFAKSQHLILNQPHYAGKGFKPHVTLSQAPGEPVVGDSIPIRSLTLVKHNNGLGGDISVLASFHLED